MSGTDQISNTLVVCGLDRSEFPQISDTIKKPLVDKKLAIVHWASLKGFQRIIAVFDTSEAATTALHVLKEQFPRIKLFYGVHTPIDGHQEFLQLPDRGKLWLISPPPSPPADWESRPEEPPNTEVLFSADQLHDALQRMERRNSNASLNSQLSSSPSQSMSPRKTVRRRITLHESVDDLRLDTTRVEDCHNSNSGPLSAQSAPSIVVEWDDESEYHGKESEEDSSAEKIKWLRTERPPLHDN